MSNPTEVLSRLERICGEATEGKWSWETTEHGYYVHRETADCPYCEIADTVRPIDAEFIAISRTALPALVKCVREMLELYETERGFTAGGNAVIAKTERIISRHLGELEVRND